ncbi:MAG: hypothetical protein ACREC5_05850 [Thermoplasmata archaeon]
MVRATPEEIDAVGRLAEPGLADRFSEAGLRRSLEEYLPRRREPIGPVAIRIDGTEYATCFPALSDRTVQFDRVEIALAGPVTDPTRWEFLRPFARLAIEADGRGEFASAPEGPPEPVMARLLLREHYLPMVRPKGGAPIRGTESRPELFTPPAFAQYVRRTGAVPFALALAVYFPHERIRYEIDLVESSLLMDGRSHRLPTRGRVSRSARIGHGVDLLVARGELSLPSARALEAVVESDGVTAMDLSPLFGGVRELGTSALDTLLARKLVSFDRRTGIYRARFEALTQGSERGRARPTVARANPRLRTSVMELLAAAESRATCPLCGRPLTAGPKRLVCEDCEKAVGASTGPASSIE